ncbi:hypothetical protein DMH08_29805 [Actinomadura sp. WAC 06369]|nr:hypothetical protein DMH08_29805 [Actinomadura sp. WAC 06369]
MRRPARAPPPGGGRARAPAPRASEAGATIAKAHGGAVSVHSPLEGGAQFVLDIPLRPVVDASATTVVMAAPEVTR